METKLVGEEHPPCDDSPLLASTRQFSPPLYDGPMQAMQRLQHTWSIHLPALRHETLLSGRVRQPVSTDGDQSSDYDLANF